MPPGPKHIVYQGHLEYCQTDDQRMIVQMRLDGQTVTEIADAMGTQSNSISRSLSRIISRAAERGYDPEHEVDAPLPATLSLKGVTNRYTFDEDGNRRLAGQYVMGRKMESDDAEFIADAIEHACSSIKPIEPIRGPRAVQQDLLNLLHCTDYHLAAYAAAGEGGADWSLDIARDQFVRAVTELIDSSPPAEVGIFSQGGDFLHYDSMEAVTPTHKHLLDASGRPFQMVELALDMHIFAIEQMAKRHRKVVAIIQEGNHDPLSSIWLRKSLARYFARNKRINVLDIEIPYYAYRHGDIMLAFHHGHKKKNRELPALFASEPRYRKMWGECVYCYVHTGHYHQREQDQSEYGGAVVERHPTLAARDAHASRGGYVSWRAMNCITYHKTRGEVSRRTTVPDAES